MAAENKRHLSPWRVLLAIFLLIGVSYGIFLGFNKWNDARAIDNLNPWFAPYVDVTAMPLFAFEQLGNTHRNLVLSFIVSSPTSPCIPTWGGAYTLDEAHDKLDLDRRIARYRQQAGNIAISFGGLLNKELSIDCTDEEKLQQAYVDVIRRYSVNTLDFDIEGESLKDVDSLKRRAIVVARIQKKLRSQQKQLAIWLTVPVSTQGLTDEGTNAISLFLANGVDLAGVNAMTMDYGYSKNKTETMGYASEKALRETHRQLGIIFTRAGIHLNDTSLWAKIGATPMLGQNDTADEIFTTEDAKSFNEFTRSNHIARMSMWSANRDIPCGENYVNTQVVSDSCSGVKQDKHDFALFLGKDFKGDISSNASLITKEDPKEEQKPDNPDESPYQIWIETGSYLEGTKVVWHHNVYQAKWWTQGNLPDDPVLQSWQTPWQLIGPVLQGEKPILQPTLPVGTYPVWAGKDIYDVGQRVLFNGVPYQSKWWTQGDSPAASTSNPDSSPWVPLTQEQVAEINNKRKTEVKPSPPKQIQTDITPQTIQ